MNKKHIQFASIRVLLIIDEIVFSTLEFRNLKITKLSLFIKPIKQLRFLNISFKTSSFLFILVGAVSKP